MHLSYRAISYRITTPAIELTETDQTALSVSNRFKVQQTTVAQRTGVVSNLKYRGVEPST
ncbi:MULTISPECIES: DUF4278 domain-containing protein [unclassified Leptolyngbya]|uniref:DUF4278 domain-containing protein n=1 Tax=unclassified Leptolyngbya TaxID=2650499 RepID=UPI00168A35EA|nr:MULTISPECIES: DUF4278 domain-containing protein [unclassified Leptolyngbya]MBD1909642.1 DUF4278 domain-containing protein [Leptolyngbya sp. FACHB-8]MBD2157581.1 DUF4278 domain-containing protein [Leptolyngbya sp. FACHB-16]